MNATESPSLTEGQRLAGCYTLKRCISSREESPVWLAQDEVLGKEVTLHFTPAAILRDQRAIAELRQEVKRNRQLIHPNILRVYDYVEDAGSAAISMDKFEGQSLAELLKEKGVMEPQEVQPWITQLAETLSDAHRIQLIHRDLSPESLIVRATGGILLTNFGISRSMHDAMERAGKAKGNAAHLSYMSPQQIDGDRPVAADDVYGLGVLIFELLAGKPPFDGNDLVPQIRKSAPPSINAVRAALGRSPVPESWQSLVDACLAKSPEQRPRSCGEVASIIAGGKNAPAPAARTEIRETATPSRSAPAEIPAKAPTESTPSTTTPTKDTTSSSVKSALPPIPPMTATKKAPAALSASFPDLDRPRSKVPVVLVGVAAIALGAGVLLRNMPDSTGATGEGAVEQNTGAATPSAGAPENPAASEIAPAPSAVAGNTGETPGKPGEAESTGATEPKATASTDSTGAAGATNDTPGAGQPVAQAGAATEPAPVVNKPPTPKPNTLIGAEPPKASETAKPADAAKPPVPPAVAEAPKATAVAETPKPAPAAPTLAPLPPVPPAPAKLVIPPNANLEQLEELLAERQAAADKLAETAKAAEAAAKENTRIKEAKQAELDQFTKTYDERRKGLAQIIQSGASVESDTVKMKESLEKAKAAAMEAVKSADAAERAYNEFVAKSGEKLAAKTKAEGELRDLVMQKVGQTNSTDDIGAQVTKAESLRQQMALALRQIEQDKVALNAQLAKARAAEAEAMKKANKEKVTAVEAQIKPLEAEAAKYKSALGQLKDLGPAGVEASKPLQQQLEAVNAKISTLQEEIKALNAPPAPGKRPGAAKPTGATVPPTAPAAPTAAVGATNSAALAVNTLPGTTTLPKAPMAESADAQKKTIITEPPAPALGSVAVAETPVPAAANAQGVNSLGMKFAPVGAVQFAIYPTTREQFAAFAKAANLKNNAWQNPWFQQGPDHPVVNVTWREAEAFCKWLTDKERKTGMIKPGEQYRLPSDLEWSKAVGLPEEKGATPEERDMGVQNVYPWGSVWPPPAGSGNFAGEETKGENPIQGYNDGYENTSPVGKFKPTASGLYDMSGNVWQWVADDWNSEKRNKTLRGGSWYNGAIQLSLLSSCRIGSSPDNQNDTYGFRVVKAADAKGKK